MNATHRAAAAVCAVGFILMPAVAAAASDPPRPRIVIDCERPRLPTQRDVGALLDQHNFAQVYASRTALMAEARRICRRGAAQVRRVVFETPAAPSLPSPPERRVADDRRDR